jgi:hypothetical protein
MLRILIALVNFLLYRRLCLFPTAAPVTNEVIRPQDLDEILGLIFIAIVDEMLYLICTDAGHRYCMMNEARMRREPS